MDIFSCTPEMWIEDEDNLSKLLEDHKVMDKIPLLNVNELHHLKDTTLVRFRGMVQDMHSPEYYLEKFEIINLTTSEKSVKSGKYHDGAVSSEDETIDFNSDKNVTAERETYVVISVPGINDWVQVIEEEKYKISSDTSVTNKQAKRSHEEMETDDIDKEKPSTSTEDVPKKSCTENSIDTNPKTQTLSKEYILNFPLPTRTGKACHLKVYRDTSELKLNDVYEFVGFLAIDPITEAMYQESCETDNKMEMEVLHPPSSLVPRIHCVSFKKLKHNNPLLNTKEDELDVNRINFIRKELLIVLTQLLLGDELAAEYLICHLISEIYLRRDLMPLGKFSLNLSNVPMFENLDFAVELYKFIENFIPKSHYLPMTLENMNDLCFIPKKDYECNRLTSGILQLSPNTHLVLDETKLRAGKLNSAGVNSVKAIARAVKNQKVTYDFNYYPLEFDCDIPFLILSEGKSLINVDVHVVLKPEKICLETFAEIIVAARHFLKPELLNDIRKFLTLARLAKYEISENVEELVQNEFVNMRQRGGATADDLHSLLVLARLLCISEGKSKLDEECWKKACKLEEQRKARITR
ncbi:mini-chromosome maintenance complex-binding protein [Anoplophora glabripennis]|uniref:mini-chromosome maintenance complex-binding protein n=1 Tax=Anoplophora glabripennis TaxID=217634 RepID=UPI0008758F90|nr:mini-chromosome maintenance complex-binding protein [Anoplophora glabripennis]